MHSHSIFTCFYRTLLLLEIPFPQDLALPFLPFSSTVDYEQSWERLDLEVDRLEQL